MQHTFPRGSQSPGSCTSLLAVALPGVLCLQMVQKLSHLPHPVVHWGYRAGAGACLLPRG